MRKVFGALVLTGMLMGVLTASCSARAVEIPLPKITAMIDVHPVPRLLQRGKQPVGFHWAGSFATKDGSHVPALRLMTVDYVKGLTLSGQSPLPRCARRTLQQHPTKCAASLVGEGSGHIEEGESSEAVKLTAYLAASSGRLLKLLVAAQPQSGGSAISVISTMKLTSPGGALHSVFSLPRINEGRGSLTNFDLDLHRFVEFQGQRGAVLMGSCPKAGFEARVHAQLNDETNSGVGDQQIDAGVKGRCAS